MSDASDDDTARLNIDSVSGFEGSDGTRPFVFTVTSDLAVDRSFTVDFSTINRPETAGDPASGLVEKGLYRVAYDEYGATADQVLILKLVSDPDFVWSMSIRGLTGKVDTLKSESGERVLPERVTEGAFR